MKNPALILHIFIFCSGTVCAQTNALVSYENTFETSTIDNSLKTYFTSNSYLEQETSGPEVIKQIQGNKDGNDSDHSDFIIAPPLLTTNPLALEICAGNRTQLTAKSNNTILWYTTPPPLGSPVGTGTSYITPELTPGYYTYYAIAESNGHRSDITAMEVVMVFPNPTLSIVSTASSLCANETATLTVSGTTYFEWENGPVSSKITIRPTTTQNFKVTGINTAGCSSSEVYTQQVVSCTSGNQDEISEKQLTSIAGKYQDEKPFSVYPNPNNGYFNISVNTVPENARVEVYNCIGSLVYLDKIANGISEINLKNHPDGIYIVRIIENNKILDQVKVIKE